MCSTSLSPKGWLPVFALCSLVVGCSPKLAPPGHYQDSTVIADGNPNDWTLPLRFSNASFTMQYNVTNDGKNLYVCVSSGTVSTQLRILRSGMTIYFDPKGEKNKNISIHFPIQKRPDPGSETHVRGNGSSGYNAGPQLQELLLQSDYYNTTGFLDMENGQFAVADTKAPIRVAIKFNNDDSLLVYEAIIPIKNILGPDWVSRVAKKNFSVGVFIDATPGTSGGAGGGGPRPGMGMRGMGMRGMGMGGGRRYGGSPGQKEDANWYVFQLASRQ
jgi:hypothetical protein